MSFSDRFFVLLLVYSLAGEIHWAGPAVDQAALDIVNLEMGISPINSNTTLFFKRVLSVIFNSSCTSSCSLGECTGIQDGVCP